MNVGTANVRSGPGTNYEVVGSRALGEKVSGPTDGEWIQLRDGAYVAVATTASQEPAQAAPQPNPPSNPAPPVNPAPPAPAPPAPAPPSGEYVAPSVSFGQFLSCTKINSTTWTIRYTWVASGGRYTDLGNAFDGTIRQVDGGTRTWTYESQVGGFGSGADPVAPTDARVFYSQMVNDPGVTTYGGSWTLTGFGSFPISVCSL